MIWVWSFCFIIDCCGSAYFPVATVQRYCGYAFMVLVYWWPWLYCIFYEWMYVCIFYYSSTERDEWMACSQFSLLNIWWNNSEKNDSEKWKHFAHSLKLKGMWNNIKNVIYATQLAAVRNGTNATAQLRI